MEITIRTIDKRDIQAPNILYKYRSWSNQMHRNILSKQEVFMANPSTFEDQKEFKNFKRYDLMTDQEVFDKYLSYSRQYNQHFSEEEHISHATEWSRNPPFRNPEHLAQHNDKMYQEYTKRIGVLSLTAYNNSLAMWNYYASNGTGICIGFDTELLFNFIGAGGEVQYPDDGLPIIKGTDSFETEMIIQTLYKEPKWKFEKEYRTVIHNVNGLSTSQRKVQLPRECFKEVVVGWNMHPKEIKSVVRYCKQAKLSVMFKQAYRGTDPVTINPL